MAGSGPLLALQDGFESGLVEADDVFRFAVVKLDFGDRNPHLSGALNQGPGLVLILGHVGDTVGDLLGIKPCNSACRA